MKLFERPLVGEAVGQIADWAWLRTELGLAGYRPADIDGYIRALQRPGALTAFLAYYKALKHDLDNGAVPTTTYQKPVLLGHGGGDPYVGAALMTPSAQNVPNQRSVEFPGKGHWVLKTAADPVADSIIGFFRTLP
jgi:pimeloyl-ACP methyl ester carboxylesterase